MRTSVRVMFILAFVRIQILALWLMQLVSMIISPCLLSPMSEGITPMILIKKIRLILSSGKRKLLENHTGPAHGARGDRAGILSVAQWRFATLVHRSTSMVV